MTDEVHEFRVRPVTRYIVTSFYQTPDGRAGGCGHGEFDNGDTAYEVAYALCKQEHERLGFPPGDERIQYPRHPLQMESALAPDKMRFDGTENEKPFPEITLSGSAIGGAL